MATKTKAKQFEEIIQKQLQDIKNVGVIRLYDVTMGYTGVDNPCDFIVYKKPKMILLECKTVQDHLLNFKSDIRENQWDKMRQYSKINGVEAGILVWFYNNDLTYYISIEDLMQYRFIGKKSFDCNKDIPTLILYGQKKKVFFNYYMDRFIKELIDD